jgi:enoyl-CoA hydratase
VSNSDILFERRGAAGVITLNRPKALNALTWAMVRAFAEQLAAWSEDGAVTRVVITAVGERAFCAGGDIRALYTLGRSGRQEEALGFWRDEYQLNAAIKHFRKPFVALVDGIVMGGGVGVSVHGSHRIAGDRLQFAMPEVGIGLFPDVGATWILPRLPGELGTYCALTGARLGPADAVAAGLATHRAGSDRLPDLLDALCGTVSVDTILGAFARVPDEAPVSRLRPAIDRLLVGNRIEDILAALEAEAGSRSADAAWAAETAATIRSKSPLSLKIALAQIRAGGKLSFDACMRTEFRIVSRVVHGHDFYEGVRAAVIDKDNAPRWQPATLEAVSEELVAGHFAPLATGELPLP